MSETKMANASELPIFRPSSAAGADAEKIDNVLNDILIRFQDRPTYKFKSRNKASVPKKTVSEKLFDSLAEIKLLTAQVAMHLDPQWRSWLFDQLDDLLDKEDWHDDDEVIGAASFETFLRLITYHPPLRRPSFGVSNRGYLIGAWTDGLNRLTIEFLPSDKVRWVLSCDVSGNIERAAGETGVRRIMSVLAPYDPQRWFGGATD